MAKINVNGNDIAFEPGATILEAARASGIDIPTLCWYPKLPIVGNCRICLVSVQGQGKLLPACAAPAIEGMVVETESKAAVENRRSVLGFLLERYPGEHLQNGGRSRPRNEFERYVTQYDVPVRDHHELPSSSRSATSSSRRRRRGLAELEERRELQAALGVPVESVDPSFVHGLRVDDVLGATICREDGIADPAEVTRALVRRAAWLGVDVRERTDALSLDAEMLVIACGADSREVAAARGVELPIRPLVRQLADVGPVPGLPAELPMTIEENGFHFRRVGARRAAPRDDRAGAALGRAGGGARRPRRRLARAARASLPAGRRCAGPPCLGRLLRHDARRAPDHRPRRRPRVRRVRLLRPRLHAVAGGRRSRCGGDARRGAALRPRPVPARALRGRRGVPGERSSSSRPAPPTGHG